MGGGLIRCTLPNSRDKGRLPEGLAGEEKPGQGASVDGACSVRGGVERTRLSKRGEPSGGGLKSKCALEDLEHQDTALPCKTLDPPIDDSDSAGGKKRQLGFYRNEEVVEVPCHPMQWNLPSACLHTFPVEIFCFSLYKLPSSLSEDLLGWFLLQVLAFNSAKFPCFLLIIAKISPQWFSYK